MKQISIDFYRVTMPNGAPTFEHLIQQVSAMPYDDTRNLEIGANPARLQESGVWNHCHEGEMVRIRMEMLPRKASLDGALEDLNFDEDEGLGEETAFLYHPPTMVLAIQRNRIGVSASALTWYFKEKGRIEEPIEIAPVLQRGVMERLAQMQTVRRLEISVAGLDRGLILQNRGHGVADIVRLSEELRAPKVSISLSMGHQRRGGLSLERALAIARNLRELAFDHRNEVQKIEIAGIDAADEKIVLDLIEERMTNVQLVQPEENRTIPYRARRDAVREAWTGRRGELAEMLQEGQGPQ
jgi:hypothetical protein